MLGVCCALATNALVRIGFTNEQPYYVRENFDAYFEGPLPDIDVQLLLMTSLVGVCVHVVSAYPQSFWRVDDLPGCFLRTVAIA